MKAIILDGSPNGDTALDAVRQTIVDELDVAWEVESLPLRDLEIRHCVGCFGCWMQTPGVCIINDAGRDVVRKFVQSDLAVFVTPVTFGGYSSQLKKAVDRLACPVQSPFFKRIKGEVHHKPRYEWYPRLMVVGVLPQADEESERIFSMLVGRNAINLHAPAHAKSVVLQSQSPDEIRRKIQTLLTTLEVQQ